MFKRVVFSILVASVLASPLPKDGRVVNGTDAKSGEIPYIVSLRSFGSHNCGGSIIDERHILTAAHCVDGSSPTYLTIQYGVLKLSSAINVVQVEKVTVHEDYSPQLNYANDVAVLKLASALQWSDNVQPIVLPDQDEQPPAGETSILAGWGLSHTGGGVMNHLQRADLLVYSDADCTKAHGSSVNAKYHLCSGIPEGGKGQCNGDSGGPLYANGKQIGAVSWSVKPCTIKGYPGVYSRVASYVDWIRKQSQI